MPRDRASPSQRHALIVLAHPEPRSFNAQLANLAAERLAGRGYAVELSDLCAQGFDPLEGPRHYSTRRDEHWFRPQDEQRHAANVGAVPVDVQAEIDKLDRADVLLLQYPMWWYQPPAILKGWLDRVFTYGGVYTSRARYDRGRYRGRRALLSVTTGAPEETFAYNGRNGDIDLLLWPMCFTLHYVGYSVLPPFVSFGVEAGLSYSGPQAVLQRLARQRRRLCMSLDELESTEPMRFNGWEDWDETGRLRAAVKGHSPFMRAEP
jgi:NAD(P)H dehydrogenase (quinone)